MERCTHCGQVIKLAYKEQLSKHKLSMLKAAAEHVMDTMVNDFDLHDLMGQYNNYNNFQKLRYHGLVHHVRNTDGSWKRGHWLITRNGWAFLRGELELPKYVIVRSNSIIDRANETISVRDVYRGAEIVQTTFEYFDEAGHPVGWRPMQHSFNNLMQASLL